MQLVCTTKDAKRLKSTAISVTPTAKANGRNRDSQKNTMKKQKEHDMVLKLQISCKKEFSFYSKTELFGKVVGVW